MLKRCYQLTFYLNARHRISIGEKYGQEHPHTWELCFELIKTKRDLVLFHELEDNIKRYLSSFEDVLLNDLPCFKNKQPTMESIAEVIFEETNKLLLEQQFMFTKLSIVENASRIYTIKETNLNFLGYKPFDVIEDEEEVIEARVMGDYQMGDYPKEKTFGNILSFRDRNKNYKAEEEKEKSCEVCGAERENKTENTANDVNYADNKDNTECEEKNSGKIIAEKTPEYLQPEEPAERELSEIIKNLLDIELEKRMAVSSRTEISSISEETRVEPFFSDMDRSEQEHCSGNLNIAPAATVITRREKRKKNRKKKITKGIARTLSNAYVEYLLLIILYIAVAVLIYHIITKNGLSPWGSDTWGHMYKTHMLYRHFMAGDYFPLYTEHWYNGIQPFRYWAPLPYYLHLVFEIIFKGDSIKALYGFIYMVYAAGAVPWIILGRYKKRFWTGAFTGILWFVLPDNLRVLLGEGNLPRVAVTMLFPYVILLMVFFLDRQKKVYLAGIFALMFVITLTHAMIAALVGISMFLFLLIYSTRHKRYKDAFHLLMCALFGVIASGIWLYPALKGGIMNMDSNYDVVMKTLTYYISQSLNPFFRYGIDKADQYYFGVSVLLISIIGIIFNKNRSKAAFWSVVIIFAGTLKVMVPVLLKLPMSQLFWMMRFTPMAMGFFCLGFIEWEKIKRSAVIVMMSVLFLEGAVTLHVMDLTRPEPKMMSEISMAVPNTSQRISLIDLSINDSDPSYHITYNQYNKEINQVFGWAWQGATTSDNIVGINTAYERGYYAYMFDRSLELGADTVIVSKIYVKDFDRLNRDAAKSGYRYLGETAKSIVYVLKESPSSGFATMPDFRYIAIGKDAQNIAFAFPAFKIGDSINIDDYSVEYLSRYEKVYLSNFSYTDIKQVENKLVSLAEKGTEIYVDISNIELDVFSQRGEFLGVKANRVSFGESFPVLNLRGKSYSLQKFKDAYKGWGTLHIFDVEEEIGTADAYKTTYTYAGTEKGINFIAFNLPYYLYTVRDENALELFGDFLGIEPESVPHRDIIPISIETGYDSISVTIPESNGENIVVPIANLDAFIFDSSEVGTHHNLIETSASRLNISITYPHLEKGFILLSAGLLLFLAYIIGFKHINGLYKLIFRE